MTRRLCALLGLLVALVLIVAPVQVTPTAAADTAPAAITRLFLPFVAGSTSGESVPTTVRFTARAGSVPFSCGQTYSLGSTTPITVTDFRFYVSNVRLLTAAGAEVPLQLQQDGQWQAQSTALLDFENGQGGCLGDARLNTQIVGSAPRGQYSGLRFELGVPFERNHLDVATAPAPLNVPALWWNWQVGYKFLRVDLKTPPVVNGPTTLTDYFIHLGSTNCPSPNGATPPNGPCARPNRATITLNAFKPDNDVVVADLEALLSGVNLGQNTPAPPGCMSGAADPDCTALFPGFGLDVASGACLNGCADQRLFRREAGQP